MPQFVFCVLHRQALVQICRADAPRLRAHPGYALATRFVPTKGEFTLDKPVVVTLEIKNVGNAAVAFRVGGQNRGPRDSQFGFAARGPSGAVPDTGDPINMGGGSYFQTLHPGETFTKDVDLRKWFSLSQAGSYTITGTYELPFVESANPDIPNFSIWQDQVAATFTVNVR